MTSKYSSARQTQKVPSRSRSTLAKKDFPKILPNLDATDLPKNDSNMSRFVTQLRKIIIESNSHSILHKMPIAHTERKSCFVANNIIKRRKINIHRDVLSSADNSFRQFKETLFSRHNTHTKTILKRTIRQNITASSSRSSKNSIRFEEGSTLQSSVSSDNENFSMNVKRCKNMKNVKIIQEAELEESPVKLK